MYRKLFYFALASSIILFTGCPSETLNVTQIERPTITSSGGNSFDSNTIISITSEDEASIYYTLDGSNPTSSSTPYSAPFEINDTSTVKAIAIMSGFDNSPIAIQTYTIVDIPNTTFAINDIAVGSEFTLFLMEDGSLWGCGFNTSGQLGMGDEIRNVLSPTKIIDSGVKSVSAGNFYAMIIKDDNSLWATGHNMKHFGDRSEDDSSTFKFIRNDVRSVSCSFGNTSIITTDGELFSTGYNAEGKPEVGTIINQFQKVSDNSTSDLIDAEYGDSYCAFLKTSGDLYVSGSNLYSIIGPDAENDYKKDYIPILIAKM